ncbi:MAG TPA: hypothetical protein ENH40_01770 [Nitrospirae bacterium]|nr:hypothetical protein [Nitrospirota bacterium]
MSPISSSENLSRFILENHTRKDGSVRWQAFKPPRDLRLSVFRTSDVAEADIWDIGLRMVAEPQDKILVGKADLIALVVRNHGLDVVSQEPPERHADIINWPAREEERSEIAMKLARDAHFTRNDN